MLLYSSGSRGGRRVDGLLLLDDVVWFGLVSAGATGRASVLEHRRGVVRSWDSISWRVWRVREDPRRV
jgi:hypothetical protein